MKNLPRAMPVTGAGQQTTTLRKSKKGRGLVVAPRPAARVIKDVDTGWVDLPSGGRMRLKFKQVEW